MKIIMDCLIFIGLLLGVLAVNGSYEYEEPKVLILKQPALHKFYIDGRFTREKVNKIITPLLHLIDINKFGSNFTILDGSDISIMIPERCTTTRWIRKYHPNQEKKFNLTKIRDSILNSRDRKTVLQPPVHNYIITKEGWFDDTTIKELKAFTKFGETFIFSKKAHDPAKNIFILSHPEIFVNYIRNTTKKYATIIYPNRASFKYEFPIHQEEAYHFLIDFEGAPPKYDIIVNGRKAAPLLVSNDLSLEKPFKPLDNNVFPVVFTGSSTELFVYTNNSNEESDYSEDDGQFPGTSYFSLESREKSQSHKLSIYNTILWFCLFFTLLKNRM